MPGRSRESRVDLPRVAAVGLLLAAAVAGVRARASLSARPAVFPRAPSADMVTAVAATEALAAAACLALLVVVFGGGGRRGRRSAQHDREVAAPPRSRLARGLALLFALAVLAAPVALLASRPRRRPAPPGAASPPRPVGTQPPHPVTGTPHVAAAHASWLAAAAVVAAVIVAVLLVARGWPWVRAAPAGQEPAAQAPAGPSPAPLRAALAEAAGPLRGPGGPRQAIIASYAAMEARLAAAGAAVAAADTPAEVLARARAAGLVRSPAADTLTALFRRARYSTHPLGEDDRAAAAAALARLSADLGGPR